MIVKRSLTREQHNISSSNLKISTRKINEAKNQLLFLPENESMCETTMNNSFEKYTPGLAKVLKVCFCSLKVVFKDIQFFPIGKKNNKNASFDATYKPMYYIPLEAAWMLWEELLCLNDFGSDTAYNYSSESSVCSLGSLISSKVLWEFFIDENERDEFISAVSESGIEALEFIQNTFIDLELVYLFSIGQEIYSEIDCDYFNDELIDEGYILDNYFGDCPEKTCAQVSSRNLDVQHEKEKLIQQVPITAFERFCNQVLNEKMLKQTNSETFVDNFLNKISAYGSSSNFRSDKNRNEIESKENSLNDDSRIYSIKQNQSHAILNEALAFGCYKKCHILFASLRGKALTRGMHNRLCYAARLLPSHFIRANEFEKAYDLLTNPSFIEVRLSVLALDVASKCQQKDCLELLALLEMNECKDAKRFIISAYNAFRDALVKKYQIKNLEEIPIYIGDIFHNFGTELTHRSIHKEALLCFEDALFYKVALFGKTNISISHTLQRLAQLHLKKGDLDQGLHEFDRALKIERCENCYSLRVAHLLKNVGTVHAVKPDYPNAIRCYEQALSVEKYNFNDCEIIAETCEMLGRLYQLNKSYDKSLDLYLKAIHIFESLKVPCSKIIGDIYYKVGKVYLQKKNYDKALESLKVSVSHRIKFDEDDPESLAKTIQAIGTVHYDMNNISCAISSFEETLRIRLTAKKYDVEEIAKTRFLIANAYVVDHQYKKAITEYQETLRILKKKFGENHDEVAIVLHKMGSVHAYNNNYRESLACFEKSNRIKEKLTRDKSKMLGKEGKTLGSSFRSKLKQFREMLSKERLDV